MSQRKKLSRRHFMRLASVAAGGVIVAGCQPKVVEKVVKETVVVEGTPKVIEKMIKETVVVEGTPEVVEKVVTKVVTAAPAAPETGVIRWADWPDMVGTKEATDQFEQENPGVKITFEPFGDSFDMKLMAQCVAGTAPDLFSIYGQMFFAFAQKGQLLDLQPYVDAHMTQEDINDFYSWHWPTSFIVPEVGILTGMPWKVNVGCLIYSKDAFDEVNLAYPDKTWDHDMYAAALQKLYKVGDGGKVVRWGGSIPLAAYDRYQPRIFAFGGHVVDPNDRTRCLLGEKPAQEALEWGRKMLWDDKVLLPSTEVDALGGAAHLFTHFGLGLWEDALNAIGDSVVPVVEENPDLVKFGVSLVPKGPARRSALSWADGRATYKDTKVRDLAWKFTHFLSRGIYQQMNVIEWQGQLSCRKSLLEPWLQRWKPWMDKGVDMSIFPEAALTGGCSTQEFFLKEQESQVVIQEALDKVFGVGGYPVTEFAGACEKVNALHQES